MIPDRVIGIAKKFKNRLKDDLLEEIFNCVDCDESWLAFETLCDHIAEYDVLISMEEYDEIMKLAADMEFDFEDISLKYLKKLIR